MTDLPVSVFRRFIMASKDTENAKHPSNPGESATLSLLVTSRAIPNFFPLLQKGVSLGVKLGCTIKGFLEDHLGLSPDYIEHRIQTLFLDAKPVDDPGRAFIRDGSTLTLSAAMPGLLGQMLRKGSVCAALRSQITHTENLQASPSGQGMVQVRLLNFVAREAGPILLEKGVWVQGEELEDLLGNRADLLREDTKKAVLNGKTVDFEGIAEMAWPGKQVFLEVRSA